MFLYSVVVQYVTDYLAGHNITMPRSSYEEIEVVDIDDPPPVTDLTDETKKKERIVRKSTGLGGKTRRVAITARPVRRPPQPSPSSTRSKKTIQCVDIDDGDQDDDESAEVKQAKTGLAASEKALASLVEGLDNGQ